MKDVRRFDVYFANLNEFGTEKHYVIVTSNWVNNCKSSYVNCCMITSKIKKHPAHVSIKINNKEAQVLCETIYTISKSKLIQKIDVVSDIRIQQKIDNALKMQLQLDNKYNNSTLEQLKDNLINMSEEISAEQNIRDLEKKVRANIKNYDLCLKYCNELIIESKSLGMNKHRWYAHYNKGLLNLKNNNIEESMEDAVESLKFVGDISGVNKNYSFSMWLIASIEEKKDNLLDALKIYKALAVYYRKLSFTNFRIAILFNIARIQKSKNGMIRLYNIALNLTNIEEHRTYMTKEVLIEEIRKELNQQSISKS